MNKRVIRSYKYQVERVNKAGSNPYFGWTTNFGNQVDQKIGKNEKFRLLLKQSNAWKYTEELTEVKNSNNHLHFNQ